MHLHVSILYVVTDGALQFLEYEGENAAAPITQIRYAPQGKSQHTVQQQSMLQINSEPLQSCPKQQFIHS